MTHTPASGPLSPVTTPPISLDEILTGAEYARPPWRVTAATSKATTDFLIIIKVSNFLIGNSNGATSIFRIVRNKPVSNLQIRRYHAVSYTHLRAHETRH